MPTVLTGELANLMAFLSDPANVIVAHLAKNPISAAVDSVALGDLVECDFPGYAPIQITDCMPIDLDQSNIGEAVSQPLSFTAGDIKSPQTITAAYLTIQQSGGTVYLLCPIIFPTPSVIGVPGQSFLYEFNFTRADLGV